MLGIPGYYSREGRTEPTYQNTQPYPVPSGAGQVHLPTSRPTTSNSQYSGYHYDNETDERGSFESRSLAGYSHMSGGAGRDSSVDKDFRGYPQNTATGGFYSRMESRNNPFVEGSALNQEANSVVQMFLSNHASRINDRQEHPSQPKPSPGKVEDLQSPTGAFGQMQVV